MKITHWLFGLTLFLCFVQGPDQGRARAQTGLQPQDVNVVNTPTVNAAVTTVKFFDRTAFSVTEPIDVSAYKQIRLVAVCKTGATTAPVTPFLMYGDTVYDVFSLGNVAFSCPAGGSRTYDLPGDKLIIANYGAYRVVLYGRGN
jgi:hypothetical protein